MRGCLQVATTQAGDACKLPPCDDTHTITCDIQNADVCICSFCDHSTPECAHGHDHGQEQLHACAPRASARSVAPARADFRLRRRESSSCVRCSSAKRCAGLQLARCAAGLDDILECMPPLSPPLTPAVWGRCLLAAYRRSSLGTTVLAACGLKGASGGESLAFS